MEDSSAAEGDAGPSPTAILDPLQDSSGEGSYVTPKTPSAISRPRHPPKEIHQPEPRVQGKINEREQTQPHDERSWTSPAFRESGSAEAERSTDRTSPVPAGRPRRVSAPSSPNDPAGPARLVISFDVGTTQSAVAIAYLPPGISRLACNPPTGSARLLILH